MSNGLNLKELKKFAKSTRKSTIELRGMSLSQLREEEAVADNLLLQLNSYLSETSFLQKPILAYKAQVKYLRKIKEIILEKQETEI